MEDNIITIFMAIIIGIIITFAIVTSVYDYNKYMYECTDYNGNIVYCVSYGLTKGNAWGTMEDGTRIAITSYKRVLREEVK